MEFFSFATFCARSSNSASTIEAGCATRTGPPTRSTLGTLPSSRSIQGARSFHALLPFQAERQVDDVAARLLGHVPGLAGELLIRGKEGEVDVLQVLRQDALDKRGLVANGLELAERLVVVEQANVVRGEIALAQHVFHLAALERSGANNGDTEQAAPAAGVGAYRGCCFRSVLHQACEASSCGGGGGNVGRRKKKESLATMPASV